MNSIIRFYLSHEISYGVARSQIFSWSSYLNEKGIDTEHLIFYTNQARLLSMIRDSHQKIKCIRSSTKPIIRDIIYFGTLFKILCRSRAEKDKIIFQTRNHGLTFALSTLKLFFKFKIIYEIRGFGENQINPLTSIGKIKYIIRGKRERKLIMLANKVFCVSNEMKRVIIKAYNLIEFDNKFVVFPGASSFKDFYSDEYLRRIVRKEHNIGDNSMVILYSGNIDQPWQVPDQIFRLFKFIEETIEARLFILTPNVEIIQNYLTKYNIDRRSVFFKNCEYNELNRYYNAADYGLLLRDNKLLNQVASPTKFSEYVLSGLPVIITDSVIDYSNFVKMNKMGFVIRSSALEIEDSQGYRDVIRNDLEPNDLKITGKKRRSEISRLGQLKLSKECFIDNQKKILTSI